MAPVAVPEKKTISADVRAGAQQMHPLRKIQGSDQSPGTPSGVRSSLRYPRSIVRSVFQMMSTLSPTFT